MTLLQGPRTTNHAEGFHNGLKTVFTAKHPSLEEFISEIQTLENTIRVRAANLQAGLVRAKARREVDETTDASIEQERLQLAGHIQANGGFATVQAIEYYLRRMSHLIGTNRADGV
ncbi:MAG: hypothetical protein GY820_13490 [Gammaproteobacteria bacterium]|nr:hypothetical protein [Gammaproteobacteria bacterium]